MAVFYAFCGVCCAAFAVYIASTSVVTDIQLGIVVTATIGAFIFFGLAHIAGLLRDVSDTLKRAVDPPAED